MVRWKIDKRKIAFYTNLKVRTDLYEVYKCYSSKEDLGLKYFLLEIEFGKETFVHYF